MTNLDSILKSRDITLLTKVHLVKSMVFPAVRYGWRRQWNPTPVLLPGESLWTEGPGGPMGLQRIGHD